MEKISIKKSDRDSLVVLGQQLDDFINDKCLIVKYKNIIYSKISKFMPKFENKVKEKKFDMLEVLKDKREIQIKNILDEKYSNRFDSVLTEKIIKLYSSDKTNFMVTV